jgi:hypothetical protein
MGKMKHNGVTPKQYAYSLVKNEIEFAISSVTENPQELPEGFKQRVIKHLSVLSARLVIAAKLTRKE